MVKAISPLFGREKVCAEMSYLVQEIKQINKQTKTMQKMTTYDPFYQGPLRGLETCPNKQGWDWVCRLLFGQEPRVFSIGCESCVPAKALTFHCEVTLPVPWIPRVCTTACAPQNTVYLWRHGFLLPLHQPLPDQSPAPPSLPFSLFSLRQNPERSLQSSIDIK